LESQPTGATFLIDGKPAPAPLRLRTGNHLAEAHLVGYRPASKPFTLPPGSSSPYILNLSLEPELLHIRLSSGLKTGTVSLDGESADELQEGMFLKSGVALSEHTFRLSQSRKQVLSFSFRGEPGSVPVLTTPLHGGDIDAIVVAELGSHARVYTLSRSLKAGLGDAPSETIPPEGLELTFL